MAQRLKIDIPRLLAMCVSQLYREGRGAEADEAIRTGRKTAEALGPYVPDEPEAEAARHVAIGHQVAAGITHPARRTQ